MPTTTTAPNPPGRRTSIRLAALVAVVLALGGIWAAGGFDRVEHRTPGLRVGRAVTLERWNIEITERPEATVGEPFAYSESAGDRTWIVLAVTVEATGNESRLFDERVLLDPGPGGPRRADLVRRTIDAQVPGRMHPGVPVDLLLCWKLGAGRESPSTVRVIIEDEEFRSGGDLLGYDSWAPAGVAARADLRVTSGERPPNPAEEVGTGA